MFRPKLGAEGGGEEERQALELRRRPALVNMAASRYGFGVWPIRGGGAGSQALRAGAVGLQAHPHETSNILSIHV
ncbi:MAG: hypothetical protein CMA59_01145 [Euryarchaeota archaeon]|nr:hypothetical protein [Euryarchaeota archaeon]